MLLQRPRHAMSERPRRAASRRVRAQRAARPNPADLLRSLAASLAGAPRSQLRAGAGAVVAMAIIVTSVALSLVPHLATATQPLVHATAQFGDVPSLTAPTAARTTAAAATSASASASAAPGTATTTTAADSLIGWPTDDRDVSSPFGPRLDPITGQPGIHLGVDFPIACGSDIRAAEDGVVSFAGTSGDYGLRTVVMHADRDGKPFATTYNHQVDITVKVGDTVKRGDVIGHIGSTGHSTGCHLHFETQLGDSYVDPMPLLTGQPGSPLTFPLNAFNPLYVSDTAVVEGESTGDKILDAIRLCESSNNYRAQNATSSASGAYQFLDSTWTTIPGTAPYAHAKDAPVAVQDAAAKWLKADSGVKPWSESQKCWGPLVGMPADPTATPSASPTPTPSPDPSTPAPGPSTPAPATTAAPASAPVPSSAPQTSGSQQPSSSTPVPSPTCSASRTPSPTDSATPTPTPTPTPSPSASATPTTPVC